MKNKYTISFVIYSLFFTFLIMSSCKKDEEVKKITPEPNKISELDLSINNFIWENMNLYYLWTDSVYALNPSNYKTKSSFNAYLNTYDDHKALFNSLLYAKGSIDRFSWIVNDYVALEKQFQGISKSMGFALFY